MEKKIKVKESCCACEADFEDKLHEMEDEAKTPTKAERDKKRSELDAAFKDKKKAKK